MAGFNRPNTPDQLPKASEAPKPSEVPPGRTRIVVDGQTFDLEQERAYLDTFARGRELVKKSVFPNQDDRLYIYKRRQSVPHGGTAEESAQRPQMPTL